MNRKIPLAERRVYGTPVAPPNGMDVGQLSRRRVSPRHANRRKCRDVRLGETDLRVLSPRHSSLRRRDSFEFGV